MRVRRGIVAALAAWLTVVMLGSAVVWAVISRAGEDLVSSGAQPGGYAASSGPGARTTVGPGEPIKSRRHHPSGSPSSSGGPSSGPSSSGTDTQSPSQGPSSDPGNPDPSSTPPSPPAPVTHDDSRSVAGGTVFAGCRGSALTSVSGVPNAGYRLEKEQGAGWAEVKFESTGNEREIQVRVTCSGGYPRLLGPGRRWLRWRGRRRGEGEGADG